MTDGMNWDLIASRLQDEQRKMIHEENWRGPDFYAEALRRTFGYRAAGEQRDRERTLPYEHLNAGQGLMTRAESRHEQEGAVYFANAARERAEEQVREMRAEVARVYREAAADLAKLIRDRCNERTVPSRYRREGVLWAADLIDPAVPKDQYGNAIPRDTDAA
ncbi:hypothetical protein ABT369_39515 [Dactylosporangium sp. NPDC000244]|uniref:hypothetical protein n=1 Tax=Dactylosporangium sp. NPDC000244 TaxID=3154365 RepID=UPI003321FD2C